MNWQLTAVAFYAAAAFTVLGLGLGWFGDWFRIAMVIALVFIAGGYRAVWLAGRK